MRAGRAALVLLLGLAAAWAGCRTGAPRATHAGAGGAAKAAAESTAAESAEAIYSASRLPIPELGYNAREGRALYQHYCTTCHGDEGGGDGFNAFNLDPRPRSLADSSFQAQRSDSDLAVAIRSGGGAVGLSTGMPPWGRTLNQRQIENLVIYVRTLRGSSATGP